jgi:hypothetical protein
MAGQALRSRYREDGSLVFPFYLHALRPAIFANCFPKAGTVLWVVE